MSERFYQDTLDLTRELLRRPSVTPNDEGCQSLLEARLKPLGFACETLMRGPESFKVQNLWAKYTAPLQSNGQPAPLLVFAGHTDVVPTGPRDQWTHDPFTPTERDGKLYGRGASDMKTSIAAWTVAVEAFRQLHPQAPLSLGYLITSDEEGPSVDGTVIVCQALKERGEKLDYCIVGEPTSTQRTGDMAKNGRRGTLSGRLTVKGVQGHVAYPHLARNPIHLFAPALAELTQIEWDKGNDHFPPTTWQVSNIHAGTGATNVIPGEAVVDFNFRFSTESSPESLQARVMSVLNHHQLDFHIAWTLDGLPFLTVPGTLFDAVKHAVLDVTGVQTQMSTTGGTSDGRFIAQICPQVIELGPPNASIHKIDEHIKLTDIAPLTQIYLRLMEHLSGVIQAK